MKTRTSASLLAVVLLLFLFHSGAQDVAKRKLLDHPAPTYPTLARNMGLTGIVKIDALVAPDGSVKTVEIRGGHPVLVQAAATAVRHWKWELSAHESHEVVEVRFSPE